MNNIIRRFRCRLHLLRFISFSRDAQLKSLVSKLWSAGFDFARFEEIIQYCPRKWKLFLQALLHRSYLQFVDEQWDSNERLEFFGDAILNFVVAEHLFNAYPEMAEGELTKLRSRLVNRKVLSQRAKEMHLSDFLLLSTSAAQSIDSGSESIIADAFEAVVGALYLDGALPAARKFIHTALLNDPEVFKLAMMDDNFKSALLEYAQANSLSIPRYTVIQEEGPEHDRRFTVEVSIGSQILGVGTGRSKKEAEQSAAAQAFDRTQSGNLKSQIESDHINAKK